MKKALVHVLTLSVAVVALAGFTAGCQPSEPVDTRVQAPPPEAGAKPDPPNPDKLKTLPGAATASGGATK